jgi:hypothetical protein
MNATRYVLASAVAATLAAAPAAASAHRPATRAEKTAIVYHASGALYGGGTLRCAIADVSTVVRGSQWAAWSFNGRLAFDPQCRRWASNGSVILNKIGKGWFVMTEGSSFQFPVPGVPTRILLDLVRGLGG